MIKEMFHKEEKKVEYIELIYDLIFVYIVGRNNSLLHSVSGGFIPFSTFGTYLLSTLVILQVWYYSTLFINRYGTNGLAEHLGLFVNMYLLYYMADGTRVAWQEYYLKYNIAWALILLNLALQYYLKLRAGKGQMPWQDAHIKLNVTLLCIEAGIIFVSIPLFFVTGLPFAPLGMVFGIVMAIVFQNTHRLVSVDFPHLTERVMLYVVFTFGEMIIAIAGYFESGFSFSSVYYSLMAFLIAAGLFLIYGFFYDHVIDRESKTTGTGYMMAHIFLVTALNNITVALEFMRAPEVDLIKKNIFLTASFLLYFLFLFSLARYAKGCERLDLKFFGFVILFSALFVIGMAASYRVSQISIAITVLYIYTMLIYSMYHHKTCFNGSEARE